MNSTDLKIAFRNILKNKIESIISILGLGIGLGCIMILGVLVIHEYSFDKFIPDYQNTYRVVENNDPRVPFPMAPAIKNAIPEVQDFFRLYQTGQVQIKNSDNQIINEELFAFADKNVFEKLGVEFRYGVPAVSNNEIAISENMAKKYFNTKNATGSSLLVKLKDNFLTLKICGVYNNFPSNSTLHPEFVADIELSAEVLGLSQRLFGEYGTTQADYRNWDNKYFYSYLFLAQQSEPETVSSKIKDYLVTVNPEKFTESEFYLQPVTDIHLKSDNLTGSIYSRLGNANELKYYMAIAFVILCIGIINYIYLTKAKLLNRLTEIGAKKALGATNNTIRKQVLLESNIISLVSIIPAFIIVISGIPFVNSTLGKTVGSEVFGMLQTWGVLFFIILLTGTLSGLFIGTSLARTSVVVLLSGKTNKKRKKLRFNYSFLSFHFAIFIVLVVSVLTFKKQINYGLTNFKAIDPNNVLICELNTPELQQQIGIMRDELAKNPNVIQTAGSSFVPPFGAFLPINLKTEEENVRFDGLIMGEGMTELLGMEIIDGEPFGEFQRDNRTSIIINESAALEYNIKAGDLLNGFLVRGIVKDFSAHSVHRLIQPMVILQQNPQKMGLLVIKTNGLDDKTIIANIKNLVTGISPESVIEINYLTDQINQFYEREQNQAKLITAFSFLAIVLAVMGLFGIVLITISRRIKEIGIRKVNGANAREVVEMLNIDFLKWVIFGFVVAIPLSWYAMHEWLKNFAYQTNISWWIFAVAGTLALIIAIITVTSQSYRAANQNPVEALRYE